jgi:bacteriorhodopsin
LFPVLLLSWVFYTLALAFNFIYIEQLHMSYYKPVRRRKKFFPAMLCLPAFLSFIWLCYQFCKGM